MLETKGSFIVLSLNQCCCFILKKKGEKNNSLANIFICQVKLISRDTGILALRSQLSLTLVCQKFLGENCLIKGLTNKTHSIFSNYTWKVTFARSITFLFASGIFRAGLNQSLYRREDKLHDLFAEGGLQQIRKKWNIPILFKCLYLALHISNYIIRFLVVQGCVNHLPEMNPKFGLFTFD